MPFPEILESFPLIDMFKAIIFDFNGVLVNDLRFHEEAYLLAAKETGFPLALETIQRHISTTPGQK